MQFGPNSIAICIIGLYLYRSLNGGNAIHSSEVNSFSSPLLFSSKPAFILVSFWAELELFTYFYGYCPGFWTFLYRHLMKPFALVFEFIPKFCNEPPPKDRPYSRIAIPSPEFTKSPSLHSKSTKLKIYLPVGFCCVAQKSESGRSGPYDDNISHKSCLNSLHSTIVRLKYFDDR